MDPFSMAVEVQGGPDAGARARRLVERGLDGRLPEDVIADISLLVTELIANGVRHGDADDDSYLHLVLKGQRGGLHVEVVNPNGADGAPARRPADMSGGGGIGLNLVATLATRWGVRSAPRTTVWFELDC